MILRLIIVMTRFAWGVRPVFYTMPSPPDEMSCCVMLIGAFIDVAFLAAVLAYLPSIVKWIKSRRNGKWQTPQ